MSAIGSHNTISSEFEGLLKFGLLIQSISPFKDNNMTTVVDKLLNKNSTVNLTQLFQHPELKRHDIPAPPIFLLALLKSKLKDVPHDISAETAIDVHMVITSLAAICVALRLYSRKRILNSIKAEDWGILISLIIILCFASTMYFGIIYAGAAHHIWDITWHQFQNNLKIVFAAEMMYQVGLVTIRTSVLILYWSLTPSRRFKRAVLIVGGLNIALCLVRLGFLIFQCKPIAFWNDPLNKKCIGQVPWIYILLGALSVVADFMVLVLPVPIVWKTMKMTTREKLMVACIFLFGLIACVGSITRLTTVDAFLTNVDATYHESPMALWSLIELDLGIIATCVPALKALVVKHFPNFLASNKKNNSQDTIATFVSAGVEMSDVSGKQNRYQNQNHNQSAAQYPYRSRHAANLSTSSTLASMSEPWDVSGHGREEFHEGEFHESEAEKGEIKRIVVEEGRPF